MTDKYDDIQKYLPPSIRTFPKQDDNGSDNNGTSSENNRVTLETTV